MDTIQILQMAFIILGILTCIAGVFCTIYGAYKVLKGVETFKEMFCGILLLGISFLLIFGAIDYLPKLKEKEQKEKQHYEQALESYTWYLDGKQVNPKTISVNNYQKEYNDGDKIVVLTKNNIIARSAILPAICFVIMFFCFMIRKYQS
jgi:hypothetical protein